MFWRMIFQSWRGDIRRKGLAVCTVALACALLAALLAVSVNIGNRMAQEMTSYGSNITIRPAGAALMPEALQGNIDRNDASSYINEKDLPAIKTIFWRNNIAGFAPQLNIPLTLIQDDTRHSVNVRGTFFDHPLTIKDEPDFHTGERLISSYWNIDGQWPDDSDSTWPTEKVPQALIGQALARQWHIKKGDQITLEYDNHRVAVDITGVLSSGGTEDKLLLMPLAPLQQLTNTVGKVDVVRVLAMTVPESNLSRKANKDVAALDAQAYDQWYCTAYVSTIAHQLEQALSGVVVEPVWQVAASSGAIIEKVQLLLIVCSIAALIAAGMGITALTSSYIYERHRQIGLMQALGAAYGDIARLYYIEACSIAIIGAVLGSVIGLFVSHMISYTLFDAPIDFPWIVWPVIICIALAITLGGTYQALKSQRDALTVEVLYAH